MIKLLIGGSPCTNWSIANKNGRETEPSGIGWELFKNFLIARQKFNPDLFLYENNKSAAQSIKDRISESLGVPIVHINSSLVSAQNRQRFYAYNWNVEQPTDRGILLRDVLDEYVSAEHITSSRVPIKIAEIGDGGQGNRLYSIDGKAVAQTASSGGIGSNTGLYAIPVNITKDNKSQYISTSCCNDSTRNLAKNTVDKKACAVIPSRYATGNPVYEVKDGLMFINGAVYPITLKDGWYSIRKLSVSECCRLQTLPDDYCKSVAKTHAYKGLGNGWTAEVIIHILNGALKNVPKDEKIVVLSMYDGIGTGRYCLDKMGFTNIEYHAYEIDEYAIRIANDNFRDIIHHGDAFLVRDDGWSLNKNDV